MSVLQEIRLILESQKHGLETDAQLVWLSTLPKLYYNIYNNNNKIDKDKKKNLLPGKEGEGG